MGEPRLGSLPSTCHTQRLGTCSCQVKSSQGMSCHVMSCRDLYSSAQSSRKKTRSDAKRPRERERERKQKDRQTGRGRDGERSRTRRDETRGEEKRARTDHGVELVWWWRRRRRRWWWRVGSEEVQLGNGWWRCWVLPGTADLRACPTGSTVVRLTQAQACMSRDSVMTTLRRRCS